MAERVVLAYSGGLDASVILHWLLNRGYDVMTFQADVGQNEDFQEATQKALKLGVSRSFLVDAKDELVTGFAFPALRAGAIYPNGYLLGGALSKPLIAQKQVEIALEEGAVLAHGATPRQNDYQRFESNYHFFAPEVKVLTPWSDEEFLQQFKYREDLLEYSAKYGIPVGATKSKPFTTEDNVLFACLTTVNGDLAGNMVPTEDMYSITTAPNEASPEPGLVGIEFQQGVPTKVIDNLSGYTAISPLEMILYLNQLGGKHGIGRLSATGVNAKGFKYFGVYEHPGFETLHFALRGLEDYIYGSNAQSFRQYMPEYAQEVYKGEWHTGQRPRLQEIFDNSLERASGLVSLSLRKGEMTLLSVN